VSGKILDGEWVSHFYDGISKTIVVIYVSSDGKLIAEESSTHVNAYKALGY
jgi:hypothetical protein